MLVITAIWLDQAPRMLLSNSTVFRADRLLTLGKAEEVDFVFTQTMCGVNTIATDIEYLMIQDRSFHLPREFISIVITAIYVPPQANTRLVMHLSTQPHNIVTVAGDLNFLNLNSVLHKFHKYVNFPTRERNTPELVYCNISQAYKLVLCHIVDFRITSV